MRRCCCILLISCMPMSHAEESMGRLFSHPNERAILNQLRMAKKEAISQSLEQVAPPPVMQMEPLPLPEQVMMQGYVKRNDGKQGTVWINQQAIQENSRHHDISVGGIATNTNRIPIKLHANGKQLSLKAGQTFEPETNQVRESRMAVDGQAADSLSSGLIGGD